MKVSRLYSIVKLYHISFLLSRHWCIQILLNHVKLLSLYIFFCRLVHTKNRIRRFRIKRKNHIYFIFIWIWLYENVIAKIVYRFKFKRKYVTLPPNRITLVSLNQKWHFLKLLQNIGTRERDFQENEIYIYTRDHERKKVWSIKAIFALSLPKIMTLPDQPDLRQPQLTFRPNPPPLCSRETHFLRGEEGERTRNNAVYNAVSSRKSFDPREEGVKRQQTLRRSGTVISTPDMANPRPFLPSFGLPLFRAMQPFRAKYFIVFPIWILPFFTALDVEPSLKCTRDETIPPLFPWE